MAETSAKHSQPAHTARTADPDTCSIAPDPTAPAGTKNSLGAKSDCNGRPTTDDSVVEAMDEEGPLKKPVPEEKQKRQR